MATMPLVESVKDLQPRGFAKIDVQTGMTYKRANTAIVIPMRKPELHIQFHQAIYGLVAPPNQQRAVFFAVGDEVGHAYNQSIANILQHPDIGKWEYILTIEDDNLPPQDGHLRLIESIESNGGYDAVGGLYWTKGLCQMPMCYGDPEEHRRTGVVNFRPLDVKQAVKNGKVMPCLGLAMGFTLWRMQMFRELGPPWFQTTTDVVHGKKVECYTQDLWFSKRAVESGKRFACDCRVRVGHIDWSDGVVY